MIDKGKAIGKLQMLKGDSKGLVASVFDVCINGIKEMPEDDGWISVKEQMPDEHPSFFNRFYGTPRWNDGMYRKTSNEVLVSVRYPYGKKAVMTARTNDGKWNISSIYQAEGSYTLDAVA